MSYLKSLHGFLLSNRLTRTRQRRLARAVKSLAGVPDAYGELLAICKASAPSAVLDVGSHVGDTVQRFLDELPNTRIHAFEPTPQTFERLGQRFGGCSRVHLHQLALADIDSQTEFYQNVNEQTNSLLDNDSGNRESFGSATGHENVVRVSCAKLDTWAQQYVPEGWLVVKADVQGAEGLLLEGGSVTFRERVIAFLAEAQLRPMYRGQADFAALHAELTGSLGFELRNIFGCFHDARGRAVQTDALWVKSEFLHLFTTSSKA